MVEWTEFRAGVAETRRYLLSHHEPREWYRCYQPVVLGRRFRLCARCSGIYPGIAAGLLGYGFGPSFVTSIALVVLLPLPALVDWILTTFTPRRGYNAVRTATGLLLGYGYGLGLGLVLGDATIGVLLVGIGYAIVTFCLLVVYRSTNPPAKAGG